MKYKVSVIIPVYNEEKYVEKCIESITSQSIKPLDTIVVDDGSTDGSILKIKNKKIKTQIGNLRIFKQKHQGAAVARNLGAKHAQGDIFLFLDADMVYAKNYIEELIRPIIKNDKIATFTRSEFVNNLDNHWACFWQQITFANQNLRRSKDQKSTGGVFRAIKASAFKKSGGFDSYGNSDDTSVLRKLKKTALAVDSAKCFHNNPSSLKEVFYSARWIGRDSNNRGQWMRFLTFSPPWSTAKSLIAMTEIRDFRFFIFKMVFDMGYFFGLIDTNLRGIYYK